MYKAQRKSLPGMLAVFSLLTSLSSQAIAAGPGLGPDALGRYGELSGDYGHAGLLRNRSLGAGISLRMPLGGQARESWRDTRVSFRVGLRGTHGADFTGQPTFSAEAPLLDLSMKLDGSPQSLALNGVEFTQFRSLNATEGDGTEGEEGGGINWWWVAGGTVVVLVGIGAAAAAAKKNAVKDVSEDLAHAIDKAFFCLLYPKHPDCQ